MTSLCEEEEEEEVASEAEAVVGVRWPLSLWDWRDRERKILNLGVPKRPRFYHRALFLLHIRFMS